MYYKTPMSVCAELNPTKLITHITIPQNKLHNNLLQSYVKDSESIHNYKIQKGVNVDPFYVYV